MIKNYILTAFRNLWRNKFFSLINIFGLSVGVACCMLIFLYAKDEVSFDGFHKNKKNIYRVTADLISPKNPVNRQGSTGMMPGPAFKKHIPEVSDFVRLQSDLANVRTKAEVQELDVFWADENLFSFFTLPLLYGNPGTALYDLHSVVISEGLAQRFFGRKDVMGQTLEINTGKQFETFAVSGVAKDAPQNSSIRIDMALPMKLQEELNPDKNWFNFYLNTFIALKPGTDPKRVEAKLAGVYDTEAAANIEEMAAKFNMREKTAYHLQPLLDMHLSTDYPADNGLRNSSNPVYSYILTGIAALVLLIACINFINLTVARSLKRAKEIGIRKVVGGERKQLIFQFLGESFALSALAFVIAAALAYAALPFFNSVSDKELAFSYLLDGKLMGGYGLLFIATALLAGFYPALVLSGFKPVETLYGKLRFSGKNYLSKGLVVFQFTLSTFLIVATITIYKQFDFLTHFDLGYNNTNIVRLKTGALNNQELDVLKTELYKNPAIRNISANQGGMRYTIAHVNGETEINFNYVHIDESYFSLFQIPLVKGRNFSKAISSDSIAAVIVNEAFAKEAGWKEPLGHVVDFYYNHKKFNVIGVVKDHHFEVPLSKVKPQVFTFVPELKYRSVFVKLTPANRVAALHHIERTFKRLYPAQPYQYAFTDEKNLDNYSSEARWKQVIAFSSLLAIFISCMGLFGLAALSAEKRAREIGIRKVLGASVHSLVRQLSADFIKLVLLASVVALPLAWWAMQVWLQNYAYHIELRIILFGLAAILVLLIALITTGFQAIKAAIANPVKSLRSE